MLAKIIFSENRRSLLQPVIIKSKSFADILIEHLGRPLTETGRLYRIDPLSDRDYRINIVETSLFMLDFPFDSPMPGGYFHFGNNHVLIVSSLMTICTLPSSSGRLYNMLTSEVQILSLRHPVLHKHHIVNREIEDIALRPYFPIV